MKRVRAAILLAIASSVIVVCALPALATESQTDPGSTTTTVAEPTFENGEPAVVIPVIEPKEEAQPWTARFIYPTIVVVTVLLIVGLLIGYNRSIRHRYRVVSGS
jgi:hypothetical protein